ncbi:glucosylglycerol 3-phosphatase [Solimonas marina]|uniref:Glucosylglycerol 3-phosphatase n=1 Tax=Solimonas marina TaxID=2714601 RepID=A0A969WCM2_9GAMM|nr:glucosylglycerol 3-phosphatase [Solimonas marina]NKF24492.1 glucosylglycerol 3-phosphatase [Solimonas marina]
MNDETQAYSLDHAALQQQLADTENLLIIQDLDGVCMDLVRDPLTRRIDRAYVEAARALDGHFYVLTNGEHIGSRGVNDIVAQVFETPEHAADQGFYLPGLAAGGVQLQDRHGSVSHPGVSDAELGFLAAIPDRARQLLATTLTELHGVDASDAHALAEACVLDNLASPTLNLNVLHHYFEREPQRYRALQQTARDFMAALMADAAERGLGDAFFVHYAPNAGRDANGEERIRVADQTHAGTTDFQFMLKGAVKEVGVLVILNHYYFRRTGRYPLGEHFNAREAPHEAQALLDLARAHFDPAQMPWIVGVGDTVTSFEQDVDGQPQRLRGGSDRGFLTLVQQLGAVFGRRNSVLFIDSSRGEVRRPGVDRAQLEAYTADPSLTPWPALQGISDADDPLRLDHVFARGHREYVAFFEALARRRSQPLRR